MSILTSIKSINNINRLIYAWNIKDQQYASLVDVHYFVLSKMFSTPFLNVLNFFILFRNFCSYEIIT